jgi:hypothetical protein
MKQCRRCHLSQIASKGYAATRAKYGEHFAIRHVRDYRLANPSSLERIVSAWLDHQGVSYEREHWLELTGRVYLIDFVFCAMGDVFAVEVNGAWAHSHHAARDARKIAALRDCGFDVIELTEGDVLSGAFKSKLTRFIPTASTIPAYTQSILAS